MRWERRAGLRTTYSPATALGSPAVRQGDTGGGGTPTSLGQNLHLALLHARDQGQLYMFKTPNVCVSSHLSDGYPLGPHVR